MPHTYDQSNVAPLSYMNKKKTITEIISLSFKQNLKKKIKKDNSNNKNNQKNPQKTPTNHSSTKARLFNFIKFPGEKRIS